MSRQVLVVGAAIEPDVAIEQAFRRLGYTRITRVGSTADALEYAARENVDLLFLPIDQVDDASLAAVDRASRQDRHMGVVATGPRSDQEYLLRAMRAGIQEFLVRPCSLEELTAVVERLHRRAEVRQVSGQTYAIFSSKGGVGVSTTAVNLASALAMIHNESRAAIVDLAMPGGDVSLLLNAKPSYTIGDLASRIDRLDADMLFSALTPAADGVWVLAMPEGGSAVDAVDATVTSSVLSELRQSFTFTLIDCEHQLTERSLAALDAADRVLLLTELKVPALRSTQRTMTVFRRLGYPTDKLCVVVNRYQSSDVVSTGDAARLLNADIFFNIPNDYKASTDAATDGVTIPIRQPQSKLALAYLQLAQKLAGGELPERSQGNGSKSRLKQLFGGAGEAEMSPVDRKKLSDGTTTKDGAATDGTTIRPARPTPVSTDGTLLPPSSRLPSLLFGRKGEQEESPVDRVKVDIHRRLIDRLDLEALERLTQKDEVITQIRIAVAEFLRDEPTPLSHAEREEIVEHIVWEVTGLGPIEPYFRDPTISDILVNNAKNIFIERGGQLVRVPVQFRNDAHVMAVIDRIVSRVGRRVDESSPMVDARLPDGSRVNAIIPPLALDGPVLSIRRFGTDLTAQHLLSFGSVTPELMKLLDGCVKARLNMLISGGTGSGKTTLLNVLSALIPEQERLITIEDAAELRLQQDHVVRLETRPPNAEGRGEVIARDLVKNALRMRPDRIIVGEVRGPEALDMLQAMNTGHEGSLSTVHANSPRDALARLETMILMAGTTLPSRAMREQIASALDVVIQVSRLTDGTRRVTSVTEVTGMEGEVVTTQELFRFRRRGITTEGRVEGQFEWTGVRPGFADRLRVAGVDLQSILFQ